MSCRKSREELNDIEKERTKRINTEIFSLKSLLEEYNIQCKKDKYSILRSTHEFILHLKNDLKALRSDLETDRSKVKFSSNVEGKEVSSQNDEEICSEKADVKVPIDTAPLAVDFQAQFTNAGMAIAVLGLDAKYICCNQIFTELTGENENSLPASNFFCIIPFEDTDNMFSVIGNLINEKEVGAGVRHLWQRLIFKDGKPVNCFCTFVLCRNAEGEAENIQFSFVTDSHVKSRSSGKLRDRGRDEVLCSSPAPRKRSREDHVVQHYRLDGGGVGVQQPYGSFPVRSIYNYSARDEPFFTMENPYYPVQYGAGPVYSMPDNRHITDQPFDSGHLSLYLQQMRSRGFQSATSSANGAYGRSDFRFSQY